MEFRTIIFQPGTKPFQFIYVLFRLKIKENQAHSTKLALLKI